MGRAADRMEEGRKQFTLGFLGKLWRVTLLCEVLRLER